MRLVTAGGLALGAFPTVLFSVASTGYHDRDDTSQPQTRKTRVVHIPESHCETPVVHLSDRYVCDIAAWDSEPPLLPPGLGSAGLRRGQ